MLVFPLVILPAVPVDPYDGRQLKYSREKDLVYSVGEDRRDQGGSIVLPGRETTPDKAEDIVFGIHSDPWKK